MVMEEHGNNNMNKKEKKTVIKILSNQEMRKLLYDYWVKTGKSTQGVFLSQSENGHYIAVDSRHGELFVEIFKEIEEAIQWLKEEEEEVEGVLL